MSASPVTDSSEVHDPEILAQARAVLDACSSGKQMQDAWGGADATRGPGKHEKYRTFL